MDDAHNVGAHDAPVNGWHRASGGLIVAEEPPRATAIRMKTLCSVLLLVFLAACDTPPGKADVRDERREREPAPSTSAVPKAAASAPKSEGAAPVPDLDESAAVIGRKRPGRVK